MGRMAFFAPGSEDHSRSRTGPGVVLVRAIRIGGCAVLHRFTAFTRPILAVLVAMLTLLGLAIAAGAEYIGPPP
jgi:hypothetical protein